MNGLTPLQRDQLLIDICDSVTAIEKRMEVVEGTLAMIRKEGDEAHAAIGQRIHNSFVALARKVDNLSNKP